MLHINQQIQAGYDQMWSTGKRDLINGVIDVDPIPVATSKRWGISAILRLTPLLSASLAAVITQLKTYTGEGHTFYDSTNFHLTLRSLEFFRADVKPTDQQVQIYTQLLSQLAPLFTELSIRFDGLSANRVGIIAQGFPLTDQLQQIRQRFHALLEERQLVNGPEWPTPRLHAHTSLLVFGRPSLRDRYGLIDFIEQHRSTNYGQLITRQIDLVCYQRQTKSVKLNTLYTVRLDKR